MGKLPEREHSQVQMLDATMTWWWLISNDEEPIQLNSTPWPKHQMEKGHVQLRRH